MKTSHHAGGANIQNHMVLRNACSGRLILMALQTSHLTSMAVKNHWLKYLCVNVVNILMFTVIVFMQFDLDSASFWEAGQVGSIYASAIISLIAYHYLMEQFLLTGQTEKHTLRQ